MIYVCSYRKWTGQIHVSFIWIYRAPGYETCYTVLYSWDSETQTVPSFIVCLVAICMQQFPRHRIRAQVFDIWLFWDSHSCFSCPQQCTWHLWWETQIMDSPPDIRGILPHPEVQRLGVKAITFTLLLKWMVLDCIEECLLVVDDCRENDSDLIYSLSLVHTSLLTDAESDVG